MSDSSKELSYLLNKNSIPFDRNIDLKKYLTFRTGGPANFFIRPQKESQLIYLNSLMIQKKWEYLLLNGGSNLLISDKGLNIVIYPQIKNYANILEKKQKFTFIQTGAFTSNRYFSESAIEHSLSGAEFLSTIPGKIGGGIYQNAGCYGYNMAMIIESIKIIKNGKVYSMQMKEVEFNYRSSIFQKDHDFWILSSIFRLQNESKDKIMQKKTDFIGRRLQSQPKNRKSAGSVFKNPPGLKAWQLIERAGLKGFQIGGAKFSEKHANFIVNENNASSNDILKLIQLAQEKVFYFSKIKLIPEIQILGDFDS